MSQTQALCSRAPHTPSRTCAGEKASRRAAAEKMLREMAFVYHATQLVKQAMTSRKEAE
jgi:hypothetical protein